MGHYTGVIFDLDGTLLDTLDDLADSMNRVLSGFGFPTHPVDAYKRFVGDGIEKLAYRVLPGDRRDERTVMDCVREMRRDYGQHWADKTHLYPGIAEMLTALIADGIILAILSNKPDSFTQKVVSAYLERWRFEMVLGAVPEIAKKPDPAGALHIAEHLELPCEKILYIGDTNTDMVTAQRAGMFGIGVLWGFREAAELQASGAKALIAQPMELLNYV